MKSSVLFSVFTRCLLSWRYGLGPSFYQKKSEYAKVMETFNLYG